MQKKLLRFGAVFSTEPTIPPLSPVRLLRFVVALIVALAICAGCSSNAEKPAAPAPGVTVTPAILKDVPVHQEWVGTMLGNVDADIHDARAVHAMIPLPSGQASRALGPSGGYPYPHPPAVRSLKSSMRRQ